MSEYELSPKFFKCTVLNSLGSFDLASCLSIKKGDRILNSEVHFLARLRVRHYYPR
jgi:hypothetical protein